VSGILSNVTVDAVETRPRRNVGRVIRFSLTIGAILLLLFAVPWWNLIMSGNHWPGGVQVAGSVVFAVALAAFPVLMATGHRRRHSDRAAIAADVLLGVIWVLFVWSILGEILAGVLWAARVGSPARFRIATAVVAVISLVLLAWGYAEARRVPRVRRVTVTVPRLGPGLDGLKLVLLTDTHYGPIDRTGWSRRVAEVVNSLDADVVAHTGDIADGEVAERRGQTEPLADIKATLARVYVTGNHEYFSGAQRWVEYMASIGWEALHNRHVLVQRGGSTLVVAGVDDRTAAGSGVPGHHADHEAALIGADPDLPVLLLAHQPAQVGGAVAHGVDLQISGHTHGGQMWPFHFLVRLDQPTLAGLSRFSERTQLYTSRGTGFWGPPFRIFAPSEITLLTLRALSSAG
jgi:predicted MPP superfamily phosphohydrolase